MVLTRRNLASNFQTSPFSLVQQLQLLPDGTSVFSKHAGVLLWVRLRCAHDSSEKRGTETFLPGRFGQGLMSEI